MNRQQEQKEKEKQALRHFSKIYTSFPKGKIEESESPDFVLWESRKKRIGIELVNVRPFSHQTHSQNENESIKSLFIEALKTEFRQTHPARISILFSFPKKNNWSELEIASTSQITIQILKDTIAKEKKNRYFLKEIKNELIKDWISNIKIAYHPDDKIFNCSYLYTKINQENLLKELELAIKKKNEKLDLYQSKVMSSYWLILSADGLKDSINFNLRNLLDRWVFKTKFDAVFLFDKFSGVWPLQK